MQGDVLNIHPPVFLLRFLTYSCMEISLTLNLR